MKPASLQVFIEKAQKTHGDKYIYDKVVYVNSRTKVIITCPKHGDFEQIPSSHIRGNGCYSCGKENQRLTTEVFVCRANVIHNSKYNYNKVDCNGSSGKVIIGCKTHGEFEQRVDAHLRGQGCFRCEMDSRILNNNTFIDKAISIHGNKYDYSGVIYKHSKSKVIITCKEHGKFKQVPYSHISGSGCPKCKQSKGEKEIQKILINKNIEFKTQHRFVDCRGKRHPLPFDFVVFSENDNIMFLLEYDGEQHFDVMRYDGDNKKRLIELQYRDNIKTKYCEDNDIPLLRIPYTKFHQIEKIIIEFMKEL